MAHGNTPTAGSTLPFHGSTYSSIARISIIVLERIEYVGSSRETIINSPSVSTDSVGPAGKSSGFYVYLPVHFNWRRFVSSILPLPPNSFAYCTGLEETGIKRYRNCNPRRREFPRITSVDKSYFGSSSVYEWKFVRRLVGSFRVTRTRYIGYLETPDHRRLTTNPSKTKTPPTERTPDERVGDNRKSSSSRR